MGQNAKNRKLELEKTNQVEAQLSQEEAAKKKEVESPSPPSTTTGEISTATDLRSVPAPLLFAPPPLWAGPASRKVKQRRGRQAFSSFFPPAEPAGNCDLMKRQ